MLPDRPRVCIDTCCIIDLLSSDLRIPIDTANQEQIWYYRKLLEASKRGDIQLFCSAFVLAECTHLKDENKQRRLDDAVKEKINLLLWSPKSGITTANLTPFTFDIARRMVWDQEIVLGPGDLVHVATAIELGAKEFITFDGRIGEDKRQAILEAYQLPIRKGSNTTLIPPDLKQGNL